MSSSLLRPGVGRVWILLPLHTEGKRGAEGSEGARQIVLKAFHQIAAFDIR